MSAHEWKPGDVANSSYGRVFLTAAGWTFDDGSGHVKGSQDVSGFRPLVVIDPEDREQVERLRTLTLRLLREQIGDYVEDGFTEGDLANAMQSALREFANPTPPKPEEPAGLGAVVEDAEGEKWLRWEIEGRHPKPWTVAGAVKPNRAYADITAVRVLSEGVTA